MKYLALIAMVASCSPAMAQQQECAPTKQAHDILTEQYGENQVFMGQDDRGVILEIWTGGDTWTALVSLPNGISCIVANGSNFERYQMEPNL